MAKLFDLDGKKQKIKAAAQSYYTTGDQDLTDAEFDALVDEVRNADPDDPIVNEIGWGYDVNLDTTPGEKVPHKYGVMGSLDKIHTIEEIVKWKGHTVIDATAKLDGLSCVAYYQNGQLVQALTRGDGVIGVDITEKFKKIVGDCNLNAESFSGGIRGELIMTLANFKTFQSKYPNAKNPRNSAVGLIGKAGIADLEYVSFIPYTVIGTEGLIPKYVSSEPAFQSPVVEMRQFLSHNFKEIVPSAQIYIGDDLTAFKTQFDAWCEVYPIDGVVLTAGMKTTKKVDSLAVIVGYDAQALKFQSETALAKVVEVEWNVGKNKWIVPRVRIEPTELAGSTVQYATGFNAKCVKENGVGVGAIVEVEKRGEIIPCINRVVEAVKAELPLICPVCGQLTAWDGVHLTCQNSQCAGQKDGDLRVWTMTLAPVDGLGWILIKKFCELLKVDTVEDLMNLKDMDFTVLPIGSQTRLFTQMIHQLRTGKFTMAKAIEACNIPRFGEKTSQQLAQRPDAVKLMLAGASVKDVGIQINLGDANIAALTQNIDKFNRLNMIKDRVIFDLAPRPTKKGKVAITGILSVSRDKFEEELRDAGYEPSGLTKGSLYLITNTPTSGTTKNQAADKWGIPKITEDEFRRKYL